MISKSTELSEVKVINQSEGVLEAFVNSMGVVDADGDFIAPQAFDNSIGSGRTVSVLWQHDQSKVIGKVQAARPVEMLGGEHRLHASIQMNMETQEGRDAFSNIAGGYIDNWSVGFNIPENAVSFESGNNKQVRHINEVDWVEVSAVLRGASPNTATISAKADDEVVEITEDLKEQEDIVSDTVEETVPDTASAEVLATVKVLQARLSLEQEKYKKKKPKR